MYLSELVIINYRSCKKIALHFRENDPNILIGVNDCGKTTILQAIGLLLEDKSAYNYVKDNSSKRDFSNSPLSPEEFAEFLKEKELPDLPYSANQTVILGKFIVEKNDVNDSDLSQYSNQLLWAIENREDSSLWIAKCFESNAAIFTTFLLSKDSRANGESDGKDQDFMELWKLGVRDLDKKLKEYQISANDITNVNDVGRFSNIEKIRAVYRSCPLEACWSRYKIEKGDKTVFPEFRYLDWNCSLEDIKKTASDVMAANIKSHISSLQEQARDAARSAEESINDQLKVMQQSISAIVPSITTIKTKVYINVQGAITDILINKSNSDGDIHLELQGEGVKRQIWFALIKAGAAASIQIGITNKKFIWAFDEPETHLYPSAQRQFFEILKEVAQSNVQVFICTHSTIFIDKSRLDTIKSIALATDTSYTEFYECPTIDTIFESLELRNSDFLFYDKFLAVEGDTEVCLIPELYRLYTRRSLREDNIQLVNLKGKTNRLNFKNILENVLRDFKKSSDSIVYLFDADARFHIRQEDDCTFFIGRQDIEDSIADEVWVEFVKDSTRHIHEIVLNSQDIGAIKSKISSNQEIRQNEKFFKQLERFVRNRMQMANISQENIQGALLPSKGTDSSTILLKHITSIDQICPNVKRAFDRLNSGAVHN